MRFGYGIGLAYPLVWLETLQISRGFENRLAPGMVIVLHAYLQLDHEDIGIIQGGTWALTTDHGWSAATGWGRRLTSGNSLVLRYFRYLFPRSGIVVVQSSGPFKYSFPALHKKFWVFVLVN